MIKELLDLLVQDKGEPYASLFLAARYSLLETGGKRLRPILLIKAVEALGGNVEAAGYPACALEMIHTYSLIHDDLPCMDNDDTRRGKPTLHRVVPEWEALLAGDFLLTRAFEVLAEAPLLSPKQRLELVRLFAVRAGAHGMIGGQVIDVKAEKKSLEQLQQMHRLKTGALLTLALEAAGVIAGVDKGRELRHFGDKIGLAYQIVDDVLDVKGKNSDAANNKETYVSLLGLEGAEKASQELFEEALLHLKQAGLESLEGLARQLVCRSV